MGSGLTPSGCQDCAFTQPQPLATVIKKPARLLFPITPHHIPAKCFRLCEQHRLGTSSGQPPLALPPLSEQSHAPEPCWGTTRGCLSPQALSCVTHHTGPAPSLSPCAAVVPTRSPGFRHCCDWAPNHQSCRSSWGKCCWRGHLGQLSPRTFCSIPAGRWRAGTQPTRCHHPPPPGAHLANRCWPKCWGQRLWLPPPGEAEPALLSPARSTSCQAAMTLEKLQGTGRRFPAHLPGTIPSTAPQWLVHG